MKITQKHRFQDAEWEMEIDTEKYVRRWIVCRAEDGFPAQARQGRNTRATKAEAEEEIRLTYQNNSPQTLAQLRLQNLVALEWWCYPGHFDPFYPVA